MYLPWDSSFFAKRIGRVLPTTVCNQKVTEAIAWAATNQIDCLYFLCDTTDAASVKAVEAHGFHLVDIRVTKERAMAALAEVTPSWDESRVRTATQADIPILKALARVSHGDSRFCVDKNFGPDRGSDLFEEWIEKSCNGWADAVLVASYKGRPAGYISCHGDTPQLGRIGLLAVADEAQRQRFGVALVEAALAWFKQREVARVSVVTQGRNIIAQRLYERCGFRTHAVQLWYHHWHSEC